MSETIRIQELRVQGQGIPWTTWGVVTKHAPSSIKDPHYFSKAHNTIYTGDFVEVLSQNKDTEEQVLLRFYIKHADIAKAVVDARLVSETIIVKALKEEKPAKKEKAEK